MALCTVEDVKMFLGWELTPDKNDKILYDLIVNTSKIIETYCNRVFDQASVTEYHDGGGSKLFVRRPPISSAVSVVLYDDPDRLFASSDLVSSDDYGIDYDNGIIKLSEGYRFYNGSQSVKITYTGGYSTIPYDIKQACIELTLDKYNQGIKGQMGVPYRSYPDGTISYKVIDILPHIQMILDKYRLPSQ